MVPPQKNFNIKVPNMHFLASGNKIQGLTLADDPLVRQSFSENVKK